jgi:hypothetical protein
MREKSLGVPIQSCKNEWTVHAENYIHFASREFILIFTSDNKITNRGSRAIQTIDNI